MPLIQPFRGLRPSQENASKVIAPPYDVINRSDAKARAKDNPHSFLHIAKAEIDCDESVSAYDDVVYQTAKQNAEQLIADKILQQDDKATYYIYQMQMGEKVQTGLVALVSTKAYEQDRVKKHEHTQTKKEDDRVKLIQTVGGQLSPVLLTYHQQDDIAACFEGITQQPALYDRIELDGVYHSLWRVDDQDRVDTITALFEAMPHIYVADGHHRSAAASRVANELKTDASQYFLSVLLPDSEMTILGYHRLIHDAQGLSPEALIERLSSKFDIKKQADKVLPDQAGQFGMYMAGQWYELRYQLAIATDDPIAQLDVTILHQEIIEPIFDIHDLRRDERIDFVGGLDAAEKLEQQIDSGKSALAFTLPATSMQQLLAVAAIGEVMPTKSTWFEPKLADGLISYLFD